jgi:transcriptional regulator with GAF, ATPase, and Fis domain
VAIQPKLLKALDQMTFRRLGAVRDRQGGLRLIASASNNVLKMVYTYVFGSRRTADLVAPGMIGLVVLSMIYAVIGL